jgi:cell division transport system ATP-binding protein
MFLQGFHLFQMDETGLPVLDDVYFSFPEGSYTVLLSENVFSATTFLKILAAEKRPASGTLRIDHQDPFSFSPSQRCHWLSEVGMVFSDLRLFTDRTVEENILFTLRAKGFWDAESLSVVGLLLTKAGLADKAKVKASDLTDGERQIVMALRAMIFRPRLLVADDPFQNVEGEAFSLLFRFLRELNKTGTTIVLSARQSAFLEEVKNNGEGLAIHWVQLDGGKLYPLEEKVS